MKLPGIVKRALDARPRQCAAVLVYGAETGHTQGSRCVRHDGHFPDTLHFDGKTFWKPEKRENRP